MDLTARQIAKLTSSSAKDVPKVAEELGMDTESARFIRRDFILQLTGKCLYCRGFLQGNTCTRCGTSVSKEDMDYKMEMLRQLVEEDPYTVVIKTNCNRCNQAFTYVARYMLNKAKKYDGNFKPSSECRSCRLKRELARADAKPRSKPKPQTRKRIEPVDDNARLVRQDPESEEFKNTPRTDLAEMASRFNKIIATQK